MWRQKPEFYQQDHDHTKINRVYLEAHQRVFEERRHYQHGSHVIHNRAQLRKQDVDQNQENPPGMDMDGNKICNLLGHLMRRQQPDKGHGT